MKKFFHLGLVCLAGLGVATAAQATNGMNMIGTGAVSSGMGGADVAVPAGCTAIAGNPAQLATTCNQVISVGSAFLMALHERGRPRPGRRGQRVSTLSPYPLWAMPSAWAPLAFPWAWGCSPRAAWALISRTCRPGPA